MANEEIIILKVQADLKQPVQSIDDLNKRVRLLRKTLKESPQEGTKAFEDLAKQISSKTGVSIEKARQQILDFQKTATNEIQKGSNALKQFNAELREIPANANSIQALRNQVKRLDKEVSQLDTTTQEFVDKSQELKRTRDRLKELEAATGDARRNVGNYTEAIKQAIAQNLNFSKRLQGLSKTLKVAFGLASIRTAISAFGRLYDAIIDRNGDANEELENLQKSTSNLTSSFIDLASDGLTFIAKPLSRFINAIAFTFDKVRELAGGNSFLGKTFQFVGRVITGVLNTLGKFPAFFSGIVAGAKQLGTNIVNSFKRIGVSTQILLQEINQFNPFSSQTTEEIEANIAVLRERQAELVESTRSVSDAFKEAFNNTLAQQEAYNKNVEAQEKATDADKKRLSAVEALEKRQKELEERIKNLIARDRDYSKEQERLRDVTAELTAIQDEFNQATNFTESQLDSLTAKQQELTNTIKERLLADQDVSEQVEELIKVTSELVGVDEDFAKINKEIERSLLNLTTGSLADYDQKINDLKEQQSDLNIESQEYINLQNQINELENKRTTILDALNADTQGLIDKQTQLNNQISDATTEQAAIENALERISKITDATENGAEKIKQIENNLQTELEAIRLRRITSQRNDIANQIKDLETQKQQELALVGDSADLRLAIETEFDNKIKELELQRLKLNADLLKAKVDQEKEANEEILEDTISTEQKKQEAIQKGLQFIGQASQGIFQIIQNTQQKAFDAQIEQLNAQQEAALRNADAIGATEAKKQAIRDSFAKKQEQLEKEQAEKRKAIAITQAIISTALAVANALTTVPLVPAGVAAAALAGALGAIQIGIISSQKFALGDIFDMNIRSGNSKFAKGSYLKNGAYHSQGGMPIMNPYTGQKVAEIEKGEAIVNRHTMAIKKVVTMTGTPYDIISSLNSMNGKGVRYPNARQIKPKFATGTMNFGGYSFVKKPKTLSYGAGGRFGISSNVLKLQQGAIVASTAVRTARIIERESQNLTIMQDILDELSAIRQINQQGFADSTTTTEDLQRLAQLRRDEANAS